MSTFGPDTHACFFCGKKTRRINLDWEVPSCSEDCDKKIRERFEGYDEIDDQLK